jgi:feruloyl esterase
MNRRTVRSFLCALSIFAALSLTKSSLAATCTLTDLKGVAPADTTIVAVASVAATPTVPAFCSVDGFVSTPGNTVNFRLGLPTPWNGKLLFIGNGGFAGSIAAITPGLQRAYATVSTDTGHQGSSIDASSMLNNLPKKIDYGYRGVHVTAVAAQALTRGFFAQPLKFSYFTGCSNGGRQAMQEVQRFKADFDGVIAGDPALGLLQLGFNWNQQVLLKTPQSFVPPSKLAMISNAVVAACDAIDGLVDGLVDDPRNCHFDPASLRCPGADAPTCLTNAQIDSVRKIYDGPRNSKGELLFPGFTVGSEAPPQGWETWIVGSTPAPFIRGPGTVPPFARLDGTLATNSLEFFFNDGYLRYIAYDNPTLDLRTYNFDTDPAKEQAFVEILVPGETDLSPFRARGGKVIMYHGWADPGLTPLESVNYYRDAFQTMTFGRQGEDLRDDEGGVGQGNGSPQRGTTNFFRLFMAPGMYHCAFGPGPNMFDTLTPLEQWVEQGIAPTSILAVHATGTTVDRTRPLCPYPQVARYVGKGSVDDAANFTCVTPGQLDFLDTLIANELRGDAEN